MDDVIRTLGIIAATLTPFTAEGHLDVEALERQIDYIVEDCHAAAISVGGVETSEYTVLSWTDRVEMIRRGVAAVGGRTPVIVGVSHSHLPSALELVEVAEAVGARAIQALAPQRPWGGPPSTAEIVRYYE